MHLFSLKIGSSLTEAYYLFIMVLFVGEEHFILYFITKDDAKISILPNQPILLTFILDAPEKFYRADTIVQVLKCFKITLIIRPKNVLFSINIVIRVFKYGRNKYLLQ
jgi:hypothetical protein